MSGRFLHVPGNRDPAPREEAVGSRSGPGTAGVPPGAVEGHVPAPARRSAPAGLAGRLDHAGCAGRGASAAGRAGPAAGTGVTGRADAPGVDVIVVGAGMAGLTAAVRLAEAGLRVVTVAKGHGSLRLAPATIDILGYGPGRVDSPTGALPGFVAAHPDHPYSLVTPELLAQSARWLPAVLGVDQVRYVWTELQEAIGRPVFEIPTIPPSVPGIRLARALQDRLRRAGGRFVLGAQAVGPELREGRLAGVRIRSAARETARMCRWVVLATGGLASGGIDVDADSTAREPVLGLPVSGPSPGEPAFLPSYLGEHPMDTVGLRVDQRLRPLGSDGAPVHPNVHAAGAVIGGARPWREKSGDGISLSTGYLA